MKKSDSKYLLIGIGNIFREDDAFGIEAVRMFSTLYPKHAEVIEIKDDLSRLIDLWNKRSVVVVDAVESENFQIFEFYSFQEIIQFKEPIRNTHNMSLAQVLQLSIELNLLPHSIYFLGLSTSSFEIGKKMNEKIKKKLPEIVQKIHKHIR